MQFGDVNSGLGVPYIWPYAVNLAGLQNGHHDRIVGADSRVTGGVERACESERRRDERALHPGAPRATTVRHLTELPGAAQ